MVNQIVHEFLTANGYIHEHVAADWEDIGCAEYGPHVVGHHAYDLYTCDTDYVFIGNDGTTDIEPRDKAFEEYCDNMVAQFENTHI